MGAGHSGFSLRRVINRRRYFYALIAADPHQTVTHAVNYWVSTGAWGETNGMREQLAQHGWVGTEIADGLDTMGGLFSTVTDSIARSDLFPQSASQPASQPAANTRYQTSRILIAARPWSATTSRTSPSRCSSMSYCSRSQSSSSRDGT